MMENCFETTIITCHGRKILRQYYTGYYEFFSRVNFSLQGTILLSSARSLPGELQVQKRPPSCRAARVEPMSPHAPLQMSGVTITIGSYPPGTRENTGRVQLSRKQP